MRIAQFAGSALIFALVWYVPPSSGQTQATVDPAVLKMFAPLPETMEADRKANPDLIRLGRMLYYEPRLSKNQQVSCNTCHDLAQYGTEAEPTSTGHDGRRGDRNSPTVYNAAGHVAQFWDGRAPTVEEQAKGPVLNPIEMGLPDSAAAVAVLKAIPGYVDAFRRAFPGEQDPVTFDNMGKAIGAFERRLVTPARWDKFLKGDAAALTPQERQGLATFTAAGCQACHSGPYLGGSDYHRLGFVKPYPDTSDPGRFKVTQAERDRMVFKAPSLRNIEKTGPYFHNGKVTALDDAVRQMATYQLGKQLSETEVKSIVAFLKSLTGEIPADYIKQPPLPKGAM